MNTAASSFWLFVLGVFSATQIRVVGSIGISELAIFLLAPFIYMRDHALLSRHGFKTLLFWAISAMVGCVIACWYNATPIPAALRGFATAYSVFAIPVVLHGLLHRNIMGFRWMLLGMAVSGIITIFAFQNSTELAVNAGGVVDENTVSDLMKGQVFWLMHFGIIPVLPVQGWYFATPMPYAVIAPLIVTGYTIAVSASGRSAILTALMASGLIFLGRKSRQRLVWIQKHVGMILIGGVIFVSMISSLYKYAGRAGWLNEQAQMKYDAQARKSEGGFEPLKLIMAGRLEFFVGLYECLNSPIIGYGPWAIDKEGIYEDFLHKYGSAEDYDRYMQSKAFAEMTGGISRTALIGGHSHILQFWLNYGILGLPYWLYFIVLVIQFFRRYISFLPQFYGFFAIFATSFLWNVFFSPFGGRMESGLFITMLLLVRAAANGLVQVPARELVLARKYDE